MAGATALFSSAAAPLTVRSASKKSGAASTARLSFAGRVAESNALRLAAPRRGDGTKRRVPLQVAAVGPVPGGGLQPELRAALDEYVNKYKVVVFMKGTAQFPQCGFSNTVVQILTQMGTEFQAVNILEDDSLRMGLKEYSAWPTFPQVYIEGEFFGGCDIMIEEYQNGNLKEVLEKAMME